MPFLCGYFVAEPVALIKIQMLNRPHADDRARIGANQGPNGQNHSDRVGEARQIPAFAFCIECENVVTERYNLRLKFHVIDDPLKVKSSVGLLLERTRRNRYGEGPNLQGYVFRDRVNPFAVRAQGEGLLQIEAMLCNFELSEGRGERHERGNSD